MSSEGASAAAPAVIGGALLAAGPPSPEGTLMWAAGVGALICAYGGSALQMLRETEGRGITPRDWIVFLIRVTASWGFGTLTALALAAVAGAIESVPAVAAHPFVVAAVAGAVAAVAPLVVPALQRRAEQAANTYEIKS